MRWVWLGLLLGVQPWLRWPGFVPDASHRLTLLACCVGLGLAACGRRADAVLPQRWLWFVSALLAGMAWHLAPAVFDAAYVSRVHEVAFLSQGVAVVLAATWGVWALAQFPARALRWLRYAAVGLLVVQLLAVSVRIATGQYDWAQGASGLLGHSRLLGTYAVAWLPVLLVWRPWLAVLPVALLVASGKPLVLCGALIAAWRFLPQRTRLVWSVLGFAVVYFFPPKLLWEKFGQRFVTWGNGLEASFAHPFVGWGFHPMASANVRTYGEMLPSFHNDWLTLAVYGGWVVAGLALWGWWRVVRETPRTCWATACQASLLALGCLAMVQDTVSPARIGGLALVLLAWWLVEQRSSDEESPGGDPAVGAVQ